MSRPSAESEPRVADADLRVTLQRMFQVDRGSLVQMERRPSPYRSSFALEELDLSFADGSGLALMFKSLGRDSLLEDGRAAKPDFLLDPRREIETYRAILQPAKLGTAAFYGAVDDSATDRFWLFIERVGGAELYRTGAFESWLAVARWLAGMHSRFAVELASLTCRAPLLNYDVAYYRRWPQRARIFLEKCTLKRADRISLDRLLGGYDRVIDRLLTLPVTLIHGDFYAANVLVEENAQTIRVCPVDWEMAALGPGLIDLAALVAGKWTGPQQQALALAYRDALPITSDRPVSAEAFLEALAYCRLHCATQWLGWSDHWSAPADHAHDWLAEALALADQLGL